MSEENPEMREMAARICRDYLHGVWKHVTAENITLKRIRLVLDILTVFAPPQIIINNTYDVAALANDLSFVSFRFVDTRAKFAGLQSRVFAQNVIESIRYCFRVPDGNAVVDENVSNIDRKLEIACT